ncbi:MAG: redox-regulated ATPase YchF [Thermoplasmata archaeon]
MEIGLVGKPNVGKSTFFNALTLLDAPMAPYPFTTTKPNRGVAAVRVACPHVEKGTACNPGNARCVRGTRWVPVNLLDVPGLVPGAHEGKGLGHQFLDDLRVADGFIQIVDVSGGTSPEGVLAPPGAFSSAEEVTWLEDELVLWVAEILGRGFERDARGLELEGGKLDEFVERRLTGLQIAPAHVATALRELALDRQHPSRWTPEDRSRLARVILRLSKPRLVAANKSDKATDEQLRALREDVKPLPVVPAAAEAELTLRRAARAGVIDYTGGDPTFHVTQPDRLNAAQLHALEEVRRVVERFHGTGVQLALESMVFQRLHQIVVFPVEDDVRWTDSQGRVLPDAFLVPAGTPARAVAYRVHTDLGENFIRAIDARTHRVLGADHPLEPGAVVRFAARK